MTEPRVSVLMPVGPRAPWLKESLQSISRQSLTGFEIVIVLDGASRENERTLSEATIQSPIVVKRTPGGWGVARSLNLGLESAAGVLIARMDSDDVAHPERLQVQSDYLVANSDVLVLGTAARLIDDRGRVVGQRDVRSGAALRRRIQWRNSLIHPSVMFRREAIITLGGYNPHAGRQEDYELWLRATSVGLIENLSMSLLDYRLHPGQHSLAERRSGAVALAHTRRSIAKGPVSRASAELQQAAWLTAQHLQGFRSR